MGAPKRYAVPGEDPGPPCHPPEPQVSARSRIKSGTASTKPQAPHMISRQGTPFR